jgi:hypothetical protein
MRYKSKNVFTHGSGFDPVVVSPGETVEIRRHFALSFELSHLVVDPVYMDGVVVEAVGVADFVDGRVVLPTVDALVREVELARSALDTNNNYWIGRTVPTQDDLDRQAARSRWRAHVSERSRTTRGEGEAGRG